MAKIVKGHCPNCGPRINADEVAHFKDVWSDEEIGISGNDDHRILHCRGCERVYFQTAAIFSEDDPSGGPTITHWPHPEKRVKPNWLWQLMHIDPTLYGLIAQTYSALNSEAGILAAIGLRTVFDRSSELLSIDVNMNFAQKLSELLVQGKIGAEEKDTLGALTDAGNAAAHRGWEPTPDELNTMFDIAEGFIQRNFLIRHAAKKLKEKVPSKSSNSNS